MALGFIWTSLCLVVFLVVLFADRMGYFTSKNHFPVKGRTVLITGGSQGMGRSVARMLASKGANIIIVARNRETLASALEYISAGAVSSSTQRFHFISADLSTATECQRVVHESTAWNGAPVDILFCCAGAAHPTLFVDTPVEKLSEQMNSNYFSSAYMAHAMLNVWLSPSPSSTSQSPNPPTADSRHIVFTSSVVSFLSMTGYAPYTPTKVALRALAETLSQELLLYPPSPGQPTIETHCIFPATIFTASYEAENKIKPEITMKLEEDDKGQTADEVAIESIKGLEAGKEMITTQWLGWAMKCGSLAGSQRNLLDVIGSWIVSLVLWAVRVDHRSKVQKWGMNHSARKA